jgi:glycosyl hydrolase family 44
VRISPANRRELRDGWAEVTIPMRDLNPKNVPFEQIVFQAAQEVGHDWVELDAIALVGLPQRPVRVSVECGSRGQRISPLIYGIAHGEEGWWTSGATVRRWGGNPNTRYNWQQGNAWNLSKDWFFKNVDYSNGSSKPAWEVFLEQNISHGVSSAITLPMIGWVAKDATSYSFPVSVFGPQQAVAPENPDMGNGIRPDGKPIPPGPPIRTSVAAPPEFIERWVKAIRAKDRSRNVAMYMLDNEPTLWDSTHRDVHPNPVSYDELLDRTLKYGAAIRAADPEAQIAGFVAWGWTSMFYSAMDVAGSSGIRVDRMSHGNMPLLPWWLQSVRKQENKTGTRLIDVLDVHFYPQAADVGIAGGGKTDDATNALRIRSTRALWDPTYRDESWIGEEVRLLPRLREWVEQYAPGMRISVGEYNFGAEGHISGGLAVAEALGHFGKEGIHSAFYWTAPPVNSPAFWAFRAFRNFDGKGGHFLDESVPAKSDDPFTAVFASREAGGHAVLVILNEAPDEAASTTIDAGSCGKLRGVRTFRYAGAPAGFQQAPASGGGTLRDLLPPHSITVVDLRLSK